MRSAAPAQLTPDGAPHGTTIQTKAPPRTTFTLFLVTAAALGFVTTIMMVAPLLVDLSRERDVPLGQAGLHELEARLPVPRSASYHPLAGATSQGGRG